MSLYEPESGLDWGSSLAEGLVFYHEGRHPGTAYYHDSSLPGNNGTLTGGPTWTVGEKGWEVTFNGTTQGCTIPSCLTGATKFTISCWVKAPGVEDTDVIFEHSANFNNAPPGSFLVYLNAGQVYLSRMCVVATSKYNGGHLNDFGNELTHLVVTFDEVPALSISEKVYYNGVEQVITVTHTTATTGLAVPDEPLYLAARAGSSLFLSCQLSGITVHNRILTLGEIQRLAFETNPLRQLQDDVYAAAAAAVTGFARPKVYGSLAAGRTGLVA